MRPYFETPDGRVQLFHGDCAELLREFPDDSFDSIVTDPPAGIGFMSAAWDHDKGGRDSWIAWMQGIAAEALRVLKPGGHALVWALPRTSHWTATAWENAGFRVSDRIAHCFGSGFPKALDVSKAIDRAAGAEREVVGCGQYANRARKVGTNVTLCVSESENDTITVPATPEAAQWDGWATALKPAIEDWWLLRKPLSEKNVAANVLKWGCGAMNIGGCRVEHGADVDLDAVQRQHANNPIRIGGAKPGDTIAMYKPSGRWPSHLIHDGSEEVLECFPETGKSTGGQCGQVGMQNFRGDTKQTWAGDPGSAARFFKCCPPDATRIRYEPKASTRDRNQGCEGLEQSNVQQDEATMNPNRDIRPPCMRGNNHPTTKNSSLMRYLCRLITPPGGVVLDMFAGSGSTLKGAILEGFACVGIEMELEYAKIARARIEDALKQPTLEGI